jgi:photosystem II stability/assembly factor-like uncharacterized protein
MGMIGVDQYESSDFGQTWSETSGFRFMLIPAFRDKLNGVTVKLSQKKFAYTSDGGKTWVETTEAPTYLNHVFYSRDGRKAFASSGLGNLWQTEDDGRTWRSIR